MKENLNDVIRTYERAKRAFWNYDLIPKSKVAKTIPEPEPEVPARGRPTTPFPRTKHTLRRTRKLNRNKNLLLAESYTESEIARSDRRRRSWRKIIEYTLRSVGVSEDELRSTSKLSHIVFARSVAAWRIRRETGKTFKEIAQCLGLQSHATALKSVRKIDYLISKLNLNKP